MIDHRIRTIRFWLLSAAVCLACCVEPGWAVYFLATYAMAPLGLFMPMFPVVECDTCANCDSDSAPCEMQLDITGITNNLCALCSGDCNSSWILPRNDSFGFAEASSCTWGESSAMPVSDPSPPNCVTGTGDNFVRLLFDAAGGYGFGTNHYVLYGFQYLSACGGVYYVDMGTTKPACTTIAETAIPPGSPGTSLCTATGSTADITAV